MPPLTKTYSKMVLSPKGGSLCVKDAFAKNFFVPGEIPLAARSHRFFGNTLLKAGHLMRSSVVSGAVRGLALLWGQGLAAPIQNGLCRSLISQSFLPKGDTNRRFRRTLRHKRFFGASDTTAHQRAGGTFIFEEENRATFLPQRREASAKVVLAFARK